MTLSVLTPPRRQALADECRLNAALLAELKPDADPADLPVVQQLLTGAAAKPSASQLCVCTAGVALAFCV